MAGHIKIDRKILNWEWYKDANMCHLFLHLLLKANWKDGKWRNREVKRGQLISGRVELSKSTGLSERQVRGCLDKLKTTNEVSIIATKQFSIITICKYELYQDNEKESDQQNANKKSNKRPTERQQNDQQKATIEEDKKIRSEEKVFSYKPMPEKFNGLPEIKIGACIQLMKITKQTDVTSQEVSDIWEVFKIQNLTGKKFYQDEDAVYSHFINWIKSQKFEKNGTTISKSNNRFNAGANELLARGKEKINEIRRRNPNA